jgi:hypothetical protein
MIGNMHHQDTKPDFGQLKGLSLISVLQMMHVEEKNCTLLVTSSQGNGELYMHKGEIIGARTRNLTGVEAAYNIISWDGVQIKIIGNCFETTCQIRETLMSLIMEAMRLKDEKHATSLAVFPVSDPVFSDDGHDVRPSVSEQEKQIVTVLEKSSGIIEYEIYDKNNTLRSYHSCQQHRGLQPASMFQTARLLADVLHAGNFRYMIMNEKNSCRFVFFEAKEHYIIAGLHHNLAIANFIQHVVSLLELQS